ncbi:MAG: hypothetical protein Q9175_000137 [Cornicularia normoerica]
MFNVIEKEMQWRKDQGLPERFDTMRKCKPVVAVGAKEPLGGQTMMADYYHGIDGLGNVHHTHPHHTSPLETWSHLFDAPPPATLLSSIAVSAAHTNPASHTDLFTPSNRHSPHEILRILEGNPVDTITLIAIGPLTNFAIAAAEDPKTFMKAKDVIVMGGTIDEPGNITPVGEFNCIADATAAARVYALTSPTPMSTMPPMAVPSSLPPYPKKDKIGDRRLNVIMFPLDVTTPHTLRRDEVEAKTKSLIEKGSPLAEWVGAFLSATFQKSESLYHGHEGGSTSMALHDVVCIWYALTSSTRPQSWEMKRGEDIRVETQGQWTRGMCVVDQRDMKMLDNDDGESQVSGDTGGWLSRLRGNRVNRCVGTPGARMLALLLLDTIFG